MTEKQNENLHTAQELLDGITVICERLQPNVNRIKMNLRREEDKLLFTFMLQALKQTQIKAATLVEELHEEDGE